MGGETWLHLGGDEGQAWDRLCFKGTAFQASLSLQGTEKSTTFRGRGVHRAHQHSGQLSLRRHC